MTLIPRPRLAAPVVAALAIAPLLVGCDPADSARDTKAPTRPVLVTTVRYRPAEEPRGFVAVIRPRVEFDLAFRVAGKVARRLVDVGQRVKAGDVLARLDDADFRLQLAQAGAEAKAAAAALEQARADEKRSRDLRRAGWQPQAAHDRTATAVEEAQGRLTRAERSGELARNALDYAALVAESDGIVTATSIEPGQVVGVGQAAIRVARLDEKEALIAAPEQWLARIREGEARLTLWSDPSRQHEARLRELSPVPDPATRTYAARFSLVDPDPTLAFGMSATLTIVDPQSPPVARIPLTALVDRGHGPGLWTVGPDGKLGFAPVSVQSYGASEARIVGGVGDGAVVVALGAQKLDAGQTVRIVTELVP